LSVALSVYCDGSSHGRAGLPGGWAFVLVRGGVAVYSRSGAVKATTSNGMELLAALNGLREAQALRTPEESVELVSDSRVVLDIAEGHHLPPKHLAEARALRAVCLEAGVRTRWVRGHSGDRWNEQVDALAHAAKQELVPARVKRKAERRRR
jgi:ribonuclease HI